MKNGYPPERSELFDPPNFLRAKVKVIDRSVDDLLARGDEVVAELREHYEDWTLREVERLRSVLSVQWSDPKNRLLAKEIMARAARDMSGQGATFEYPLVGQIASLLAAYLEVTASPDQDVAIINAHLDAIRSVVRNRVLGSSNAVAHEMVRTLAAAGRG